MCPEQSTGGCPHSHAAEQPYSSGDTRGAPSSCSVPAEPSAEGPQVCAALCEEKKDSKGLCPQLQHGYRVNLDLRHNAFSIGWDDSQGCWAVFSTTLNFKLALVMGFLHFIVSHPHSLIFVSWGHFHTPSCVFMCFWGNILSRQIQ